MKTQFTCPICHKVEFESGVTDEAESTSICNDCLLKADENKKGPEAKAIEAYRASLWD